MYVLKYVNIEISNYPNIKICTYLNFQNLIIFNIEVLKYLEIWMLIKYGTL